MRISDWSSDVCSSDLGRDPDGGRHHVRHRIPDDAGGGGCAHVGEHHNRRLQRAIAALLQGAAMSDWGNQMRVIFAMPGNEAFAQALAEAGGFELGVLETRRFPDGESYVRLLTDVTDKCVDLVCTLARPDEGFLSLVFAADAARDLGVREVTLVAPYLSYMRQDRRFQLGEAVSSKSFARLVSATFDRLVTVDPHLHRYPALSTLYTIPDITLHAAPALADLIAAHEIGRASCRERVCQYV